MSVMSPMLTNNWLRSMNNGKAKRNCSNKAEFKVDIYWYRIFEFEQKVRGKIDAQTQTAFVGHLIEGWL